MLTRLMEAFKPNFHAMVVKALRQWVEALPVPDRESKCIFISSASYSPLEILHAVEQGTILGKEFVTGLSALQQRMMRRNPKASVADLIRRSVNRDAAASA